MPSSQHAQLFAVRVDDTSFVEAQEQVKQAIAEQRSFSIATLNPEILLHAKKELKYREILNAHTLNVVDGVGLQRIGRFRNRVTGVELAEWLCTYAAQEHLRVACVVRADGLSMVHEVHESVRALAPGIDVSVYPVSNPEDASLAGELIGADPEIALVGLGFPAQERWVIEHGAKLLPHAVFLSVGGTFDYWTGAKKRAPRILQRAGLEWLWRLMMQPKRIVRIFRAVVVFPLVYWFSLLRRD